MDPFTHITAGAIGAQAIRNPQQRDRYLLLFCILAAWLPDIDNFIGFLGTEFYLIYHRGLTHSFFGGILFATVFVGIFKLFVKPFPFKRGFILAYLFIALHIFLDLITSYGTQIFFPLTNARYALTSVFIIDPIYTLVMIYFMYRTFRSPKTRKIIAIAGMIWIFLYPAINLGIRYTLQQHVENRLKSEGMEFTRIDVSTDALTPFFWKAIIDDGTSYRVGGVSLLKPNAPISFTNFQKADHALFQEFGKSSSVFNTFAWFFDYPVMKTETSGTHTMITFGDLKFISTVSFIQNLRGNEELPFSLTAILDENRQLVGYIYHRPGRPETIEQLK